TRGPSPSARTRSATWATGWNGGSPAAEHAGGAAPRGTLVAGPVPAAAVGDPVRRGRAGGAGAAAGAGQCRRLDAGALRVGQRVRAVAVADHRGAAVRRAQGAVAPAGGARRARRGGRRVRDRLARRGDGPPARPQPRARAGAGRRGTVAVVP